MKTVCAVILITLMSFTGIVNKPVERVDMKRFGGTWYCLYSIPTMFDRGSREMTTHYNLNKNNYFDVVTTCKKDNEPEVHTIKSKIFPEEGVNSGQMKTQFVWPIKIDYWVVDLASDYSYTVIGHPGHKFLYIMARKP